MEDFLTLNIYGENDEIVKTYRTNHVRFKLFKDAVALSLALTSIGISVFVSLIKKSISNVPFSFL